MSKGIVFRRIGGRIIPVRVSKGFTPDATVKASSATLKKALKGKISARTSLQEKRIKAVSFVREAYKNFRAKYGDGRDLKDTAVKMRGVPSGIQFVAYEKPNKVAKIPWQALGKVEQDKAMSGLRYRMDTMLYQKKLVPETFRVETPRHTYFVQDRVDAYETMRKFPSDSKMRQEQAKLVSKVRNFGVNARDLNFYNMGRAKNKKWQTYDTGEFQPMDTFDASYHGKAGVFVKKFRTPRVEKAIEKKTVRFKKPWLRDE